MEIPGFRHSWAVLVLMGAIAGPSCAPLEDVTNDRGCVAPNSTTDGAARLGIRGPATIAGPAAMSFKTTRDGTLATVVVKLIAVKPTPTTVQTGQIALIVESDLDGTAGAAATVPSGSVLGYEIKTISDLGLSTSVSTSVTFTVGSVSIEANHNYWLVIDGNYTPNATNYVAWVGSTGNPYSLGGSLTYDFLNGSWTTISTPTGQDQYFTLGCI